MSRPATTTSTRATTSPKNPGLRRQLAAALRGPGPPGADFIRHSGPMRSRETSRRAGAAPRTRASRVSRRPASRSPNWFAPARHSMPSMSSGSRPIHCVRATAMGLSATEGFRTRVLLPFHRGRVPRHRRGGIGRARRGGVELVGRLSEPGDAAPDASESSAVRGGRELMCRRVDDLGRRDGDLLVQPCGDQFDQTAPNSSPAISPCNGGQARSPYMLAASSATIWAKPRSAARR